MKLIPREEKFFKLFNEAADLILEGSKEFQALTHHYEDVESKTRNIKVIENKADDVTHATVELLHKTFITPLDRGDIYQLITRMDDILDMIEAASQRMHMYNVTSIPTHMKELAEICVKSVENIRSAVINLEHLKKPNEIVKHCVEVNRLENDADHILRVAIADLFRNEPDIRQLIKFKELYELLETVTDRCEDVANIIEGIVLEYA